MCTLSLPAWTAEQDHAAENSSATPVSKLPHALNTMAKIAGTWKGAANINGNRVPFKAVYTVTAAGTAVTEVLTIGDQEMVSVYHKDGDKVAMTHYCSWGNKPHMELTQANARRVSFDMLTPRGIQSESEPHMRGVTLSLRQDGVLEQQWDISFAPEQRTLIVVELERQS
jgi:hypothetical protein